MIMTPKRLLTLIFPPVYGLLVYATVRLVQDTQSGYHFWNRPRVTTVVELSFSMVVGVLMIFLIRLICRRNDRKQSIQGFSSSLIAGELITVILLNAVLVNVVLTPMAALTDDGLSLADLTDINIIPLLYVLVYYGIVRSRIFLKGYIERQVMVERLTNDKLETELKFLKAQYHPHFLFNALNTVYFQMDEDIPAAKTSIEKISELLRYQLYDQQDRVTIRQELHYLTSFIDLQKVRSSHRLKLSVDIDDQLQSQLVHPLLLLPLVENAFKYTGGDYDLSITAKYKDGALYFEVINSVQSINVPKAGAGGIGLENLKCRLNLLYPGAYEFVACREQDQFTARLTLPLNEK